MKAIMLEFLINLFSEQVSQLGAEGGEIEITPEKTMSMMGSTPADLLTAMGWLASLHKSATSEENQFDFSEKAIRAYLPTEYKKLGGEGMAFIDQMVRQKVLTPMLREVIIHHCLQLEADEIEISQLRWIVFMALAAKAKDGRQLAWLDYLVLMDNEELELTEH